MYIYNDVRGAYYQDISKGREENMSEMYNTQPAGLEKWVDGTLNKNFPVQLPDGAKKWLADNSWWLALVGGVLSLWSAWGFWQAAHYVSQWARLADDLARYSGVNTVSSSLGLTWWLAFAAILAQGVLMLVAYPKLKAHSKSGWNLLFYSSFISLAVGVLYLLTPAYGFGSLIGTLLGTAIGWWVLFQMRGHFVK